MLALGKMITAEKFRNLYLRGTTRIEKINLNQLLILAQNVQDLQILVELKGHVRCERADR